MSRTTSHGVEPSWRSLTGWAWRSRGSGSAVLRDLRGDRDLPADSGDPLPDPSLLWTNPKVGNTQSETGGILAPLLGTALATSSAMLLATPVGVGMAVWFSEYARPRRLARAVESTVEMFAGRPVDRAGAVRSDPVPGVVHGLPHREDR